MGIQLKKIHLFKNKFNDKGEPSLFYKQNHKYIPVLYQAKDDLNLLYMKTIKGQFHKFNRSQIKRLTGISELDLNLACRKDLRK
jgi:hypothetical protein